MKHPIVGALVDVRLDDGQRLVLVESVVFPRRKPCVPQVVGRLHGGPDTLAEGDTWRTVAGRYQGARVRFPIPTIRRVLVDGEAWVPADEYLAWAETYGRDNPDLREDPDS